MEPSRRSFPTRNVTTTEAALMTRGVSQLYLLLGDPTQNGDVAVRLYFKPHVLLIWVGAAIMLVGGALSLSDRRLRVGAPAGQSKSGLVTGGVKAANVCMLCKPASKGNH
jgi:cytochrome c-type biogenesis protein CcmF